MNELDKAKIALVILFSLLIGVIFSMYHDIFTWNEKIKETKLDYIETIPYNATGKQKIDMAKQICAEHWLSKDGIWAPWATKDELQSNCIDALLNN